MACNVYSSMLGDSSPVPPDEDTMETSDMQGSVGESKHKGDQDERAKALTVS